MEIKQSYSCRIPVLHVNDAPPCIHKSLVHRRPIYVASACIRYTFSKPTLRRLPQLNIKEITITRCIPGSEMCTIFLYFL